MDEIKRGYLYIADLDPVKGSEQGGRRPVLVVQNDAGNQHSPTVIIAAITSLTNSSNSALSTVSSSFASSGIL